MKKPAVLAALAAILVLGGFQRFSHLRERGPNFFDEGIYTLEGQWIYSASKSLASALKRKIEETRARENLYTFEEEAKRFREEVEGQPPSWGRPGFSLLTGIAMAIVGPRLYAGHAVSAFFGTLAILGVFLLGKKWFDAATGLLAALLLALSGYHLVYSTNALADGTAMSVAVFCFLLYGRSRPPMPPASGRLALFGSGLLCGFAFTIHDRFLYCLLVLFLCEGIDFVRGVPARRQTLRRGLLLGSAFLIPLCLFEMPYYLGMVFLRHFNQALPFRTYFEELATHHIFNLLDAFAFSLIDFSDAPEIREAGSHLYNFLTYPYLFFRFDGPVLCLALLAGLGAALRRPSEGNRILLVWFSVPLVLFSVGLVTSSRYGLVFLPALMLLAAQGLSAGWQRIGKNPRWNGPKRLLLASAGVAIVVASGWLSAAPIRSLVCNYEGPAGFLRTHGSRHVSLQYPVSRAYLGVANVAEPPESRQRLRELYEQGYRYFLVDYRKFFLQPPFASTERPQILKDLEERLDPVYSEEHPCYLAPAYLFEVNLFFRLTLKLVREAKARGVDRIDIYDLASYFDGQGSSPPEESRSEEPGHQAEPP